MVMTSRVRILAHVGLPHRRVRRPGSAAAMIVRLSVDETRLPLIRQYGMNVPKASRPSEAASLMARRRDRTGRAQARRI